MGLTGALLNFTLWVTMRQGAFLAGLRVRLALTIALLVGVISAAMAQGGPPLLTDDAGTTPQGHWEINLAGTLEHTRSARVYELPLADINYGISPRAQLKWEFPYIWQQTPGSSTINGLGDSTIGVRYRFLDEDGRKPAISTYPQLSFNNSSSSVNRGLVDRETTLLIPFQIQRDLGPVSVNLDLGYNIHWGGVDEWQWGLAFGREMNSRLELLGEIYTTAEQGFHNQVRIAQVGCRYRLDNSRQFLVAIGTGLSGPGGDRPSVIGYLGIKLER